MIFFAKIPFLRSCKTFYRNCKFIDTFSGEAFHYWMICFEAFDMYKWYSWMVTGIYFAWGVICMTLACCFINNEQDVSDQTYSQIAGTDMNALRGQLALPKKVEYIKS